MRGKDHNRILGMIHMAYGVLSIGFIGLIAILMLVVILAGASDPKNAFPAGIMALFISIFLVINVVFTLPSFVAGYAMLKRKRWARTASIVAAVMDGMSFPLGTALCIYTLWFIFSDQGRLLYDNMRPASALAPSPPWASASAKQRELEYIPPVSPPDWR